MDRDTVYHVVFYDDIDGIISAAIFLHKLLESNKTYRLYPASSQSRGDKFESLIKSMKLKDTDILIILDYEYHTRCNLWVDHHFSPTMGNEQVINDKIVYDPNAKSAASLLLSHGTKHGYVYSYNTGFIKTVDMIDKVEFKSVNQIFTDTNPLMILRAYIERTFHSEMMFSRVVEMLAYTSFDFGKALYQLKIDKKKIILDLQAEAAKTSKEMVICGNMSVIRQSRPGKFPKYAEFYIKPEIKYAVRLSRISMNKLYLQIGSNKWHQEPNSINIGKMLSGIKYLTKGGGHYSVGGGVVEEKDCEELIDDLSVMLNNGVEMSEEMEKVGVDKENDPIESKAEEMVKTGEVKSIDEARKKALLKEEEEKANAADD